MNELDLRTIFFTYLLTNLVCLIVMFFLWYQVHNRFKGIGYLVLDALFQSLCTGMIFLRGNIPDFISIDVSNTLAVTGAVLGFVGLGIFTNKKSNQFHNILLIVIFFCVHIYFTFINPNLPVRNLNSAFAYLIICSQCAWLLLRRLTNIISRIYLHVGIVFLLFSVVSFARVFYFFYTRKSTSDYFHGGDFDTFVILSYQIFFMLLIFFLTLMVNKRLLKDIETQEEKFSKAFHSAPYGIIISRLSDGIIVEVNDGFERISGYNSAEVIGKTTPELNVWSSISDRERMIELFKEMGTARNVELSFIRKSGEHIVGEISGEIININNESCTLTVVNDITNRKLVEKQLLESQSVLIKFASHLQSVGEEEKILLADRIDNELNQTLAALRIDIGLLKNKVYDKDIQPISDDLFEKLDRAYNIAGESLATSVRLMSSLRHEVLHLMGFTEAIKLYLSEFESNYEIQCEFKSNELNVDLQQNQSITLFKVFQSAMSNIAKYSRANKVKIQLNVVDDKLIFEIADNGIGFKFDGLVVMTSNGLMLMKERVLLLEGYFDVKTAPGQGTTIIISIPYTHHLAVNNYQKIMPSVAL